MGWVFNATFRQLHPKARRGTPTVQEAGWAPGPVWTGAENLAPTGIRSPNRPARSESLYRLNQRFPTFLTRGALFRINFYGGAP